MFAEGMEGDERLVKFNTDTAGARKVMALIQQDANSETPQKRTLNILDNGETWLVVTTGMSSHDIKLAQELYEMARERYNQLAAAENKPPVTKVEAMAMEDFLHPKSPDASFEGAQWRIGVEKAWVPKLIAQGFDVEGPSSSRGIK